MFDARRRLLPRVTCRHGCPRRQPLPPRSAGARAIYAGAAVEGSPPSPILSPTSLAASSTSPPRRHARTALRCTTRGVPPHAPASAAEACLTPPPRHPCDARLRLRSAFASRCQRRCSAPSSRPARPGSGGNRDGFAARWFRLSRLSPRYDAPAVRWGYSAAPVVFDGLRPI